MTPRPSQLIALLTAGLLLSGCATSSPDPGDAAVRRSAADATTRVNALAEKTRGDSTPVWAGNGDVCSPGENDWKTRSGYQWLCVVDRIEAVTLPGRPEQSFSAADRLFAAAGCRSDDDPSRASLATMLQSYRDQTTRHDLPEVRLRCGDVTLRAQPTDGTDPRLDLPGDGLWATRATSPTNARWFTRQAPDAAALQAIRTAAGDQSRTTLVLDFSQEYHRS